ncbi:uncharacterized protein BT62DRAFT_1007573 [Guyanagaster necrorhizus]|uniref:Uncharacterized protein n=1 Tax=Guyanagaster necrorhizus TaxID=856835 RepID=A0A9P7VQ19_9AGAR|nr:uncharacterized protein BT62DRAFT_1007573 [Guyanagaster necrorhizus MCA 3950]KAG7444578.1 hypothetical protein BT62DRAFT_1007573 [Guyanagaster necrorhizus MCA 3950]
MLFFLSTLSFSLSVASASHTIRFFNYCGSGTPSIVTHNSKTSLNSTGTYYSDNANDGTIHTFLDQGSCGDDEEKCTTVNVDLTIPEASISQYASFRPSIFPFLKTTPATGQTTTPSLCLYNTPAPTTAPTSPNATPPTATPRPYHAVPSTYDSPLLPYHPNNNNRPPTVPTHHNILPVSTPPFPSPPLPPL